VAVQPLEHAAGLDREDEFRPGAKFQMFHGAWNSVGAAAEAAAVDFDRLAGPRIAVKHGQLPGDRSAMGFRIEAQLFTRQPVRGGQRLDIVHHGIGFRLFVEARVAPVFRNVIGLCRNVWANVRAVLTVSVRVFSAPPSSKYPLSLS
jgi:hypothetical protein